MLRLLLLLLDTRCCEGRQAASQPFNRPTKLASQAGKLAGREGAP